MKSNRALRRLILVSSNTSGTGRQFASTARRMNFEPVLLDPEPGRFTFVREMGIEAVRTDLSDDGELERIARYVVGQQSVAGVTSSSEYYQATAARLARTLGLAGGEPDALGRCRDKSEQRRTLAQAGLGQPRFSQVSSSANAVTAARKLGFPVVVKPVDGTGSVGVTLAADEAEVLAAVERLLSRATNERGLAVVPRVLIEEYVRGPEFSVELWHGRALGVTQKFLGQHPWFVEIGHTFPAPLSATERAAVVATAEAAVTALGVVFGAAHVELRLAADGPAIVEVNSRLAGGFIPTIVALTGTDLIAQVIGAATRSDPPAPPAAHPAAAIRFVLAPENGTLVGIDGVHIARGRQGVEAVSMYAQLGQQVGRFGDFRDRIGHVIAVGGTPEQASARAEAALDALHVSVVPQLVSGEYQ